VITLGIETSCDETSAAVVEDGRRILSNVVSSQVALHQRFGGVVPELAARLHLERLPGVVDEALKRAGSTLDDVDLISVTRGPGLIGALLVGVGFARGMAMERGIPLVGVSHLDGHIHSAFLESPDLRLPLVVLLVSGGHTELVLVEEGKPYQVLGRTLDDAAGEAFDKVARLLGLGYPGGPEIDSLATGVDARDAARRFPLPAIRVGGPDFSFSGIKTAVRYALEKLPEAERTAPDLIAAAAASFQARVVEHLVDKLVRAWTARGRPAVSVAGGVALNSALRARVRQRMGEAGAADIVFPSPQLCTDNAAMIAAAGHGVFARGEGSNLAVEPGLRLGG
jgi:N6-L-threonylcarbamoyladenine synthase